MKIKLYKFGTVLVSRPEGREAHLAFQPNFLDLKKSEPIVVDFNKVEVFTPSWGDEFLTPLVKKYKDCVSFINTKNASVTAVLEILELTGYIKS